MVVMPIERGKVREYATATAAARPAYLEHPLAPIPPTFLATVIFWTPIGETVVSPEVRAVCAEVGIEADIRNLLSLGQEYVFHGPIPRVGDVLHTSERLDSVEVKPTRHGPMVRIRFVVSFHDESGDLRAECFYTSGYLQKEAP